MRKRTPTTTSAPPPLYVFANWRERFETSEGRKYAHLRWLALPAGFGDEYATLVEGEAGPSIYGCYVALLQVAVSVSPRERRGELRRESGRPHDAVSLASLIRMPKPLVEGTLAKLLELGIVAAVEPSPEESPEPSGESPEPSGESPGYGTVRNNNGTDGTDGTDGTVRDETNARVVVAGSRQSRSPEATSVSSESMETAKRLLAKANIKPEPLAKLNRFAKLVELCGADDVAAKLLAAQANGVTRLLAPTLGWLEKAMADFGSVGLKAELDAAMKGGAK